MAYENLDQMINFSRNSLETGLETLSRNTLEFLANQIKQSYVPRFGLDCNHGIFLFNGNVHTLNHSKRVR